jgi:hypothetical protein
MWTVRDARWHDRDESALSGFPIGAAACAANGKLPSGGRKKFKKRLLSHAAHVESSVLANLSRFKRRSEPLRFGPPKGQTNEKERE